jgi:SnoaL-like protein
MRKSILFPCLLLSACASVSSQSVDSVREVIDRLNSNAARWYAAGDVDSVVSIFADDAWQMPPNNPPLVGRQAIRDFWRQAVQWCKWESRSKLRKSTSADRWRSNEAAMSSDSRPVLVRRREWPRPRIAETT